MVMGSTFEGIGSTLPVPSVQHLIQETSQGKVVVPPRYIRHDRHLSVVCSTPCLPLVPVISFQKLLAEETTNSELQDLHRACRDWGIFQLVDHGVDLTLVDKVKLEVTEFFNLPKGEKEKYGQRAGDAEGYGQLLVHTDDQKLDWADMLFMVTLPAHSRKPHLFPSLPLSLRNALEVYSTELQNLAVRLLEIVVKSIGMDLQEVKDLLGEGRQTMRMNYYPPCPCPDQVIGFSPHSDASALTILLQINEVDGLEIRKDGIWIPVKVVPNAFVVNLGDTLEILTNGVYHSVEHRVVVNSMKERLSIGTFYTPRLDAEIGPAHSLVSSETPAVFRRIRYEDYLKGYLSRKPEERYLDWVRLQK